MSFGDLWGFGFDMRKICHLTSLFPKNFIVQYVKRPQDYLNMFVFYFYDRRFKSYGYLIN